MATSRQTIRDALETLLTATLVGEGLPVKTVTGSKVDSLAGNTPLVGILSGPAARGPLAFTGNQVAFDLEIQVLVRQSVEGSWTPAQAGDALDEIEALIAGAFETNRRLTGVWDTIHFAEPTTVLEVVVASIPYYWERIPVRVTLAHN